MKHLIKPLFIAMSLSGVSATALAQLYSPNVNVNSIHGDNVTATAGFPAPVTGDLYVATLSGGTFLFIGEEAAHATTLSAFLGALSTTPLAVQYNGHFTENVTVIDIPSATIPPGTYALYQVLTRPGTSVMDVNNWIGGLNSLSGIKFKINLANTPPPPPVTDTTAGKAKYKELGCAAGGCHTANPTANKNKILNGKSLAALKAAILKRPGDMGYLADPTDLQFASDTNLQAIADYLKTF
jgi:hypothetical protein